MLIRVETIYGDRLWIDSGDLERAKARGLLVPIRCQTGRKWCSLPLGLRPSGSLMLHPDNIAKTELTTT